MTDALITTLAQIRALRVISRTSVMRFKGARQPLPEIAKALNVDAIIEGTVLRSQGRVRIARAVDSRGVGHAPVGQAVRERLRDVLALQSDVARAIADEIQIQLSPQERSRLARSRPVDPAAYEAFLKGRHFWYRRSPTRSARAWSSCNRRSRLDPSYALAHAGLADAYACMGWDLFGLSAPSETFQKPDRPPSGRSRSIPTAPKPTPRLADTARVSTGTGSTAEREFRHAIDLKPQYGPVHIWYSHLLKAMDRTEESLAESRRALECDPLGLVLNMHMGWHLVYSRQYDKAVEQCQKTLELDPTFILAHVFLGQAYEQSGCVLRRHCRIRKGRRAVAPPSDISGGPGARLAVAGRRTDALNVLDELHELSSQRYVAARGIAEIHIGLGDIDEAFGLAGARLPAAQRLAYSYAATIPATTDCVGIRAISIWSGG